MLSCIYAAGLAAKLLMLDHTWALSLSLFAVFALGWPIAILVGRRSARLVKWSWSWP
jgi:hypothetical protein